ncbi:MAG: hypothetical protein FJ009_20280 [Chloroflexi bacterium]|nr:hypothetical protein [Chloroflexota bacterium]
MLKARKVLDDCRIAYGLLESETNESNFRVLWVAGIALARAVGHVLDKVDSKQDKKLGTIIARLYDAWKRDKTGNKIYWEFIKDERNRVLKEYEVGFLSGPIPVTASGEIFVLDENLHCPISDGAYAGEDCRDVLKQSIEWWEMQLQAIELEYQLP